MEICNSTLPNEVDVSNYHFELGRCAAMSKFVKFFMVAQYDFLVYIYIYSTTGSKLSVHEKMDGRACLHGEVPPAC